MTSPHLPSASELPEIPLSTLSTLPALELPPGIQPNFVNPENRGFVFVSVGTILFSLMALFYLVRIYTKILIIRKAGWDDRK